MTAMVSIVAALLLSGSPGEIAEFCVCLSTLGLDPMFTPVKYLNKIHNCFFWVLFWAQSNLTMGSVISLDASDFDLALSRMLPPQMEMWAFPPLTL
jgi:hypothetical protein